MKNRKPVTTTPIYTLEIFVSIGLSITLFLLRSLWSGDWYFWFLIWNTFLASIPLVLSQILRRLTIKKITLPIFFLSLCWMAFFPNAPYLITDLIHIYDRQNVPLWLDTIMLFLFALSGFLVTLASWNDIRMWLKKIRPAPSQRMVDYLIVSLTAVGLYIGRFLRWNTWDLLRQPIRIFRDLFSITTQPRIFIDSVIFIVIISMIFIAFHKVTGYRTTTTNNMKSGL